MTRHLISDSRLPFPIKPGVRYRVIEKGGELVVREIGAAGRQRDGGLNRQ